MRTPSSAGNDVRGRVYNAFLRSTGLLVILAAALMATQSQAALVLPTHITTSVPAGSNNPASGAFTDDVFLESLTFAGATFTSGASFSAVKDFVEEEKKKRGHIWSAPRCKSKIADQQKETLRPYIRHR